MSIFDDFFDSVFSGTVKRGGMKYPTADVPKGFIPPAPDPAARPSTPADLSAPAVPLASRLGEPSELEQELRASFGKPVPRQAGKTSLTKQPEGGGKPTFVQASRKGETLFNHGKATLSIALPADAEDVAMVMRMARSLAGPKTKINVTVITDDSITCEWKDR